MRPDRGDRRTIRKGLERQALRMSFLPIRRRPITVVPAWSRDTSGTLPFPSRTRALRSNVGIPCRCIQRWAWRLPRIFSVSIRINLWGVRKSQTQTQILPGMPFPGSAAPTFDHAAGCVAAMCRRLPASSFRAEFIFLIPRSDLSRLLLASTFAACATGSQTERLHRR